jgi:hypothetical protein
MESSSQNFDQVTPVSQIEEYEYASDSDLDPEEVETVVETESRSRTALEGPSTAVGMARTGRVVVIQDTAYRT